MPTFGKLTLSNYVLFKNAEFDFGYNGITAIQGLNLNGNSSKSSDSANTNAVGKSVLVSAIPDLFLKEGITGSAKDKFRGGEAQLEMTDTLPSGKKRLYVIKKFFKGAAEAYSILRDGADITPKGIVAQRSMVELLLRRDADTFNVVDYLDNNQPHLLRTGDTAARRKFFTTFFDLTSPDEIKRLIKAERDQLKAHAGARGEAARLLDVKTAELAALPKKSVLSARELELKASGEKASAAIEAMREARALSRWIDQHSATLALLKKRGQPSRKDAARRLKSIKEQLDTYQDLAAYQSELAAYRKAMKAFDAKLAELGIENLAIAVSDLTRRQSQLDVTAKELDAEVQACNETANKAAWKYSAAKEALAKAKEDLAALDEQSVCSQCGQAIKTPNRAAHKARHEDAIASMRKELSLLKSKSEAAASIRDTAVSTYESLTDKLDKVTEKLDDLEELKKPERPQKPDGSALDEGFDYDKALRIQSECESILEFYDTNGDSEFLARYATGERPDYSDEAYDTAVARSVETTAELRDIAAKLADRLSLRTEITGLTSRLQEIDTLLGEAEVLEVLERAFSSNTGVKQLVIKSLCRILEDRVNTYARNIFPEDYRFEFDLETQFTITAIRTLKGGEELPSDVRKLSGAEASFFDISLALALRSFQPAHHRSNVIILDELNANFGPDMMATFMNILPKINKIIPHVIVISPRTKDSYPPETRYVTVVKRGRWSKVVDGKVLQ